MGRMLPARIADITALETLLSEPTPRVVEVLARLAGDIIVLGAGGKMGPTLARMARRASDTAGPPRRVIAVSRFTAGGRDALEGHGVETIASDLLDHRAVAALPDAPYVIYMAGRKFGSTGNEPLTWAMNCHLPSVVCQRYPSSRIVAFSTGNVYGLTLAGRGGSKEDDPLRPVGEYAMSCLGRERMFDYFSREGGTDVVLLRLNYAVEMRYGVLVDLASRILADQPIDLAMGFVNVIWQGDANAMALAALERACSPASVVNIAGPDELRVRDLAERLGGLLGRPVQFTGLEAHDALLSNGARGYQWLGRPIVPVDTMLAWTAKWLLDGGATSGKPTHFASRDGRF
jgi:nucleoside-diphosphate-sugar epimerase